MPVFVTVKPFSPCELWSVDVSGIQIEPGIPVQKLKQAGFELLVAYIDYLATHCRTVLASRTLESESSPVGKICWTMTVQTRTKLVLPCPYITPRFGLRSSCKIFTIIGSPL